MIPPPHDDPPPPWVDPPDVRANRERMHELWVRIDQLLAARLALTEKP